MKPLWHCAFTVEDAERLESGTFAQSLGIEFTQVGPDFLAGRMRLAAHLKQPFGVLHGGVSVAFAETIGSVAANFAVDPARYRCVGQSINASHLRPVQMDGSYIVAIARPAAIEPCRQVWEIELSREDKKLFCVSTLTMAVIPHDA